MSKHNRQADSARFCSALFTLMIGDIDKPTNCRMVIPMSDVSKYESDISRVSNMVAKYLDESPVKYESN